MVLNLFHGHNYCISLLFPKSEIQNLEFFAIVPQVDMSTARDFAGFFHRTGTIIRDPKVFQFYSVTHFILPGLNANFCKILFRGKFQYF